MVTMEASSTTISWATAMTARASQRFGSGPGGGRSGTAGVSVVGVGGHGMGLLGGWEGRWGTGWVAGGARLERYGGATGGTSAAEERQHHVVHHVDDERLVDGVAVHGHPVEEQRRGHLVGHGWRRRPSGARPGGRPAPRCRRRPPPCPRSSAADQPGQLGVVRMADITPTMRAASSSVKASTLWPKAASRSPRSEPVSAGAPTVVALAAGGPPRPPPAPCPTSAGRWWPCRRGPARPGRPCSGGRSRPPSAARGRRRGWPAHGPRPVARWAGRGRWRPLSTSALVTSRVLLVIRNGTVPFTHCTGMEHSERNRSVQISRSSQVQGRRGRRRACRRSGALATGRPCTPGGPRAAAG